MLYQVFDPPPILAPFVQFYWVLEDDVVSGTEFVHRSIADVGVEMVFHYRAKFDEITEADKIDTSPIASIQAQSTKFRRFTTGQSFGIFGAYLYPFAIPRFFSLPARDFTNISPDLESVLGHAGRRLDQMMAEARSNEQRASIISKFLSDRLESNTKELDNVHQAVHTIRHANGIVNISQLAREYSYSTRQFERKFKEFAGLSPKTFSRVVRFQAATKHRLSEYRDLTEIAYSCGYYDQSHFINEFREFSGYTPKEYFWNEAEGTQYMDAE